MRLLILYMSMSLASHVASFGASFRTLRPRLINRHFSTTDFAVDNATVMETVHYKIRREIVLWRKDVADELQKPLYNVLQNRQIDSILCKMPMTLEDLETVPLIGPKTMQYGPKLIDIITKHVSQYPTLEITRTEYIIPPTTPRTEQKKPTTDIRNLISFNISYDELSPEQQQAAINVINNQTNVFITGSAGTGKSYLLRYIIQELRKKYGYAEVAVTAPTGIAAVNIGGTTIHSFAGIGIGPIVPEAMIEKSLKRKEIKNKLKQLKALIIDEISMLDIQLFELLDLMAKKARKSTLPFGGIQLIVVGDFLQLPPVRTGASTQSPPPRLVPVNPAHTSSFSTSATTFPPSTTATTWTPNVVQLPSNVVQAKVPIPPSPSSLSTQVYTRRSIFCFESDIWKEAGLDTDHGKINLKEVIRQKNNQLIDLLNCIRIGKVNTTMMSLLDNCIVDKKPLPQDGIIPTKLYCTNIDVDNENFMRLQEIHEDEVVIEARDVWKRKPTLNIAYKRMIETAEKTCPSSIILKCGAQVVLLRNRANDVAKYNRNLDRGIIGEKKPLVNGSRGIVIGFTNSIKDEDDRIPKVKFDDGQIVTISKVEHEIESPDGDGYLVRSQIPLKLAWAATVHKSQGTTLSRVELMVNNAFDYGQTYVALSRVSSLEGLWLTKKIPLHAIRAHPIVLKFYGYNS